MEAKIEKAVTVTLQLTGNELDLLVAGIGSTNRDSLEVAGMSYQQITAIFELYRTLSGVA